MPTPDEYGATDAFVQYECAPHADEAPSESQAEEPTAEDSDEPLDGYADIEWEVDIAHRAEHCRIEDVADLAHFDSNIDDENGASQCYDFRIFSEKRENASTAASEDDAENHRRKDAESQ